MMGVRVVKETAEPGLGSAGAGGVAERDVPGTGVELGVGVGDFAGCEAVGASATGGAAGGVRPPARKLNSAITTPTTAARAETPAAISATL
ncbi:hypothetical protein GCM10019017_25420 [Streptomyces showdoensis]